ncbi:hypothetical protein P7K49_037400, partial [Saguinus oedipus]
VCLSCSSQMTCPFDFEQGLSDDLNGGLSPLLGASLGLSEGKCPTLVTTPAKGPCSGVEVEGEENSKD